MCNNTGTAEVKNGSDTEILALPSLFSCFGNQFRDWLIFLGYRKVAGRQLSLLFVWLVFNNIFLLFLPFYSPSAGLLGQRKRSSILRHFLPRRGHVLEFGLDGYVQKLLLCVWAAIFLSLWQPDCFNLFNNNNHVCKEGYFFVYWSSWTIISRRG